MSRLEDMTYISTLVAEKLRSVEWPSLNIGARGTHGCAFFVKGIIECCTFDEGFLPSFQLILYLFSISGVDWRHRVDHLLVHDLPLSFIPVVSDDVVNVGQHLRMHPVTKHGRVHLHLCLGSGID